MSTLQTVVISVVAVLAISETLKGFIKDFVKFAAKGLQNFFFVTIHLHDHNVSAYVIGFLRSTCKSYSLGEDYISHKAKIVEGRGSSSVFFRETTKSLAVYFYHHMPIFVTPFIDKGASSENKKTTLRFFKGTVRAKRLFQECGEFLDRWSKENATKKYQIVRLTGVGNKDEGKISSKAESVHASRPFEEAAEPINFIVEELAPVHRTPAMELLSQTPAHKRLQRDLHFWRSHEKWYSSKGLPWRRGYMLHGGPGTGKTSLIRALCEDEDIPVILMDLSSMTNNQFNAAWEYARDFRPRAVLLEDFDSVFQGRRNVASLGCLDFSTVLNAIDGIEQENGMLLFVTTNHPENIDPALGQPLPDGSTTRPGRLDASIEIPPLDYDGRLKIALRIVEDMIDAKKLVQEGLEDTPAKFIERCKQFALAALWENDLTATPKNGKVGEAHAAFDTDGEIFGGANPGEDPFAQYKVGHSTPDTTPEED